MRSQARWILLALESVLAAAAGSHARRLACGQQAPHKASRAQGRERAELDDLNAEAPFQPFPPTSKYSAICAPTRARCATELLTLRSGHSWTRSPPPPKIAIAAEAHGCQKSRRYRHRLVRMPRRHVRAAMPACPSSLPFLPVPCVPARPVRPDPAAFALPQRSRPDRRSRRSGP